MQEYPCPPPSSTSRNPFGKFFAELFLPAEFVLSVLYLAFDLKKPSVSGGFRLYLLKALIELKNNNLQFINMYYRLYIIINNRKKQV